MYRHPARSSISEALLILLYAACLLKRFPSKRMYRVTIIFPNSVVALLSLRCFAYVNAVLDNFDVLQVQECEGCLNCLCECGSSR